MIKWLPWLPDKSAFINCKILEILRGTPNTQLSVKFLEQRVDELVERGPPTPCPPSPPRQRCGGKGLEIRKGSETSLSRKSFHSVVGLARTYSP